MNLKHERKRKIRQTDKNGIEKETEFREYKERGKIKKKEETHTRTHKRKKKMCPSRSLYIRLSIISTV